MLYFPCISLLQGGKYQTELVTRGMNDCVASFYRKNAKIFHSTTHCLRIIWSFNETKYIWMSNLAIQVQRIDLKSYQSFQMKEMLAKMIPPSSFTAFIPLSVTSN